ncbi:hypothetical protein [Nocardia sp. BMG51109]|uniref:hypothetical protein n=1 Tax=Nocardia sp. BMG51109 TaxID=1056816 RepID=UPI000465389A|nr:hypothetical protein [Nocardia sp. BMG51109]
MPNKFESPADWSPPGSQFQNRAMPGRTVGGVLFGLVVTPVGIALAAKGGADIRYWVIVGRVVDRWTAALEIVGGSVLLLLVVCAAAFSPLGTTVAGLVWGILPGILHLLFPDETFALMSNLAFVDQEMQVALHAWVTYGFALISGFMLLGAGIVGTLRHR